MSKTILVFNNNSEQDVSDLKQINNAKEYSLFIWELESQLRKKYKYEESTITWDEVREWYYELKNEYNIKED